MQEAETIEEAVAILKASPRPGAANLLIADGIGGEAVVVEMSSKTLAVRPAVNGTVYSTNHFVSDEMFNPENKDSDSTARLQRLEELAKADHGLFDLAHAVSLLRDHIDPHTGSTAPDGDIIGNPLNMLSVIFHPADLTFWVANGPAPSSYRSYVGFSLQHELEGTQAQAAIPEIPPNMSLSASTWAEIEAYQAGRRAYGQGDDSAAAEYFSKALATNPVSPRYGYNLAGALMNLGRYDEALSALRNALRGDPQSGYRPYIYYRLGLIYEKEGKATEMREAFQHVLALDSGDEQIESYARRALGQ